MGARKQSLTLMAALCLMPCGTLPAAGLPGFGNAAEQDILPAAQALMPRPPIWEKGVLTIGIDVAPGAYLYVDKFKVEALEPALPLKAHNLPAASTIDDPHFGQVAIWRDNLIAEFASPQPPRRIRLRYQGCLEDKVCYPPQSLELDVEAVR